MDESIYNYFYYYYDYYSILLLVLFRENQVPTSLKYLR